MNSNQRGLAGSQAPTYGQKLKQANREAVATVVGLVVTIFVWAVCGFGLAGLDVELFHTPLWIVTGTLGSWACAVVVAIVLARRFFADFDLDDDASCASVDGRERARE